jgi:hypothetical protein
VLAGLNMKQVLRSSDRPLLFREMKDCLLHSTDVIERALTSFVASGDVAEDKGYYRLVK